MSVINLVKWFGDRLVLCAGILIVCLVLFVTVLLLLVLPLSNAQLDEVGYVLGQAWRQALNVKFANSQSRD
ncbi:MAG: hypothetical protein JWO15_3540 [Sphingomonadales bacterium]|nr:hypothetical protein [Sphingomonadales bacterium]